MPESFSTKKPSKSNSEYSFNSSPRNEFPAKGSGPTPVPQVWTKEPYPHITPGEYQVRVVAVVGPTWVRAFSRWSLRLDCQLTMETIEPLSLFFSLGDNPEKPDMGGLQSKVMQHWMLANGDKPPRRGQVVSWEIFRDKYFMARVEDAKPKPMHKKPSKRLEVKLAPYSHIAYFTQFEGP